MHTVAVIPALNEVANLPLVLTELQERAAGWVDEVVVVDGGSTDGTPQAARRAGARVITEPRRGYGRALAAGVAAVPGADLLVFLDSDGSDDPAAIPRLAAPVLSGEADFVLGSRLTRKMALGTMPAHQLFGNWLAGFLIRRLYRQPLTDLSPMRAIRADVLRSLEMREMTYGWPTEMIVKAIRRGYRIVEVPVQHRPRLGGKSKISGTLKGSLLAAYYILGTTLRYVAYR